MKKSKSIVGIAVGVSSIVLIVAGVIAHRSVQALADTSSEVLQSKELELSLERLLSSVRDAETGQRGYILTGSEDYLFPYDEALRAIDGRLLTVEVRMQARAGAAEQLRALRGLVKTKLDELARTIELQRSGEREAASRWCVRTREVRHGCHPHPGRRRGARRAAQRRASHGAGGRCAAGDAARQFLGECSGDRSHDSACLRGAS
jgi:CHASE3 domain sensor protein